MWMASSSPFGRDFARYAKRGLCVRCGEGTAAQQGGVAGGCFEQCVVNGCVPEKKRKKNNSSRRKYHTAVHSTFCIPAEI